MSAKTATATILIRDNTPLPKGLALDSEFFLPGWRALTNYDGLKLGRRIEAAEWNFFFLAGPIRTTVLGREGLPTLRRAVNRILTKRKGQDFNSLEITKLVSKRFLGIPHLSVSAHSRHPWPIRSSIVRPAVCNANLAASTAESGPALKCTLVRYHPFFHFP